MSAKKKDEFHRMPFDDALRKILNAPPQHKAAKKKKSRQKSKRS